ncbi:MAG: hypothetical protein JOZ69_18410 [Myxococcales bacterium]|nr:hypothetical protein [Myxococcales bacterium]
MSGDGPELRFDRATYAEDAGGGLPCANCRGPLGDAYWKWQRLVVCARCRDALAGRLRDSQSSARFARALVLGGLTALGCGVAYATLVGATHARFALATIGIAFVIARVLRKASLGIGGTRYQIAAVALTYFSATMGYIPEIWGSLRQQASAEHTERAASAPPPSPEAQGAAEPSGGSGKASGSPRDLVVAVVFLVGIMLAAPFLTATQAPLGLIIVGFGLWEAWKLSRGPPLHIEGPFRAGATTGQPTP